MGSVGGHVGNLGALENETRPKVRLYCVQLPILNAKDSQAHVAGDVVRVNLCSVQLPLPSAKVSKDVVWLHIHRFQLPILNAKDSQYAAFLLLDMSAVTAEYRRKVRYGSYG